MQASNEIHLEALPYNLAEPEAVIPTSMPEPSGLCWTGSDFALVQDELGVIYQVNHLGKSTRETIFRTQGDFEDVCVYDSVFLVLRSDGHLFLVDPLKIELGIASGIQENSLGFKAKNDFEGIYFSHRDSLLYVACKGFEDPALKHIRCILRYQISPDFKLNLLDTFAQINMHELAAMSDLSVLARSDPRKRSADLAGRFNPSAITALPDESGFVVLSAESPGILVLDNQGRVEEFQCIPRDIWPQPEGICFGPNNKLWVVSEKSEKLYRYSVLKQDKPEVQE